MTTSTATAWGIAVPPRRRWLTAISHTARRLVAAAMLGTVLLLGGTVALLAPTSSPAHADILGISSSVQDWICGFVNPSEPWGALGDGPESWLSNLNLAQARQVPVLHVDSAGSTFSAATPSSIVVPEYMDQLPALPAGDYTLYEIAGLRGLTWWTMPLTPDGKNRDCDLWNYVWSEAGNLVFTANKVLLQVVIATKEAAASNNPLSFLYDDAAGAISSVFSAFFVPIATLMLIAAGIWAAISALRQTGLRALIGAIGAAAAIMALGGFMYSVLSTGTNGFRSVAAIADESISQVNAAATNALFDNLTGNTGACSLPEDVGSGVRGQRLTSCILADSLAYRPWAVGQFGGAGAYPIPVPDGWTVLMANGTSGVDANALINQSTLPCYVNFDNCRDLRTYLIAQHGGIQVNGTLSGRDGFAVCSAALRGPEAQDIPAWMTLDDAVDADDPLTSIMAVGRAMVANSICSPMYRVFIALSHSNTTTAAAYSGEVGVARVSQAASSLIGTGVAGFAVLIMAIITMGWHAMTFAHFLIGPFKLVYACYPSKTKMATEWLGDLAHAWLARLVYGIMLSLTILLVVWMLSSQLSFGLRLVWLGVILFLFWKLAQKLQEMVRPATTSGMNPNMTAAITSSVARGKNLTRRTTQAAGGAARGAQGAVQRQAGLINDPTRGRTRRTISALSAPVVLAGGIARGATSSPQAEARRAQQTLVKQARRTENRSGPATPTGPNPRRRNADDTPPPINATALPAEEPADTGALEVAESAPGRREPTTAAIPAPRTASETPDRAPDPDDDWLHQWSRDQREPAAVASPRPRRHRRPVPTQAPAPGTPAQRGYEPAATPPAPPLY